MATVANRRTLLAAAILVVVVLVVGVVNYFVAGRFSGPAAASNTLAPERLLPLAEAPRLLLHLDWGDGTGSTTNDSLEQVFFSEDRVFVVDHTVAGGGPRVRWFDSSGKTAGEFAPPIGALGFTPAKNGFSYLVSAITAEESEVAALYDIGESRLTTYTVPLGLNAARLVEAEDVLYAQVDDSTYDPRTSDVRIEGRLVPVANGGRQVTDAEARRLAMSGAAIGLDGKLYGRTIEGKAIEGARPIAVYGEIETSATLSASEWSTFLGVDRGGRGTFLFQAEENATRQSLPGVTATGEQFALLLFAPIRGGEQWLLPVKLPRALQMGRSLFSLAEDGVVVTQADARGVDIYLYRGAFE